MKSPRLSAEASAYISRLLLQAPNYETIQSLQLRIRLLANNGSELNSHLNERYSRLADLAAVILQLENLVYLHHTLASQSQTCLEALAQKAEAKQQILQLLGFGAD